MDGVVHVFDLPKVQMRLRKGVSAHRAPTGEVVLWDGERQAWIGPNGEGKRHGLMTLIMAKLHAAGRLGELGRLK